MNADLSDEELVAVTIAIAQTLGSEHATTTIPEIPLWSLAMRRSDLEFDDLLLLRNACSRRF